MKLPELPKPDFMEGGRDWPLRGAWIECQMQAYGEACYRAAIGDAAKAADEEQGPTNGIYTVHHRNSKGLQ
jgi:predicted RNA-binding protein YlxR (DUF448 family)